MSARQAVLRSARWLLYASAIALLLFAGVPMFQALLEPARDVTPARPRRPWLAPATLRAVEQVLSPGERGDEPTLELLVEQLHALDLPAIPVVIALTCGELELPELVPGSAAESVHPRAIELREAALRASLARFPPSKVAEHLREFCSGEPPFECLLVAAQLLGEIDDPTALECLLAVAAKMEPIQLQRVYVREPLELALAQHFERHPRQIAFVEPSEVGNAWPVLVRAAGAAHTTTTAQWLADLLGRDAELDRLVIAELARVAEGGRFALPPEVLERMRDVLTRQDDGLRRVAAIALGAARDAGSFDDLVFLLDETDPLVVAAARSGLTWLTRQDFGLDAGRWLDWRVAQDEWYAERSSELFDDLSIADAARASQAMAEMLAHAFFRHEWAFAIGALAVDAQGPLFETACASLEALGSARAVPWLAEALEREDEAERELAARALRALTGLQLSALRQDWASALEL